MVTLNFSVPYTGGTVNLALQTAIVDATMSISGSTITVTKSDNTTLYSGTDTQSALNAAVRATTNPTVYIQGTYNLPSRLTGQGVNNVTIIFADGAKLRLNNNVNQPVFFITGVYGWLIRNSEVDGNMANNMQLTDTNGIYIHNSSNCEVDGAYIHDCRIFGCYIQFNCINCGIVNSFITNCGWNGITLSTDGSNGSYALNNEVSHVGDVGISTYVTSRVNDNYIHDMDGLLGSGGNVLGTHWAIGVEGGSDAEVLRNTIANADCGVVVNNSGNISYGTCDRTKIKRNKMSKLKVVGVEIHSSNNEIGGDDPADGNQILDWASWKNAVTIEATNGVNSANGNLVKSNIFSTVNANANGVDVRAGVTNTTIGPNNNFTGVTGQKIVNSGTGTVIVGNTGYP